MTVVPTVTVTSTPLVLPTYTLIPTVTPVVMVSGYSYYYPDLGGVNCHDDNWNEVTGRCADITASGETWRDKIGRAVALSPSVIDACPYGSSIVVLGPPGVVGEYRVIDLCPGCDSYAPPLVDFLDDRQRLPWQTLITWVCRR